MSPEAHIPLCRSLALKNEHTLLEHLRLPEVLTQNYHTSWMESSLWP